MRIFIVCKHRNLIDKITIPGKNFINVWLIVEFNIFHNDLFVEERLKNIFMILSLIQKKVQNGQFQL